MARTPPLGRKLIAPPTPMDRVAPATPRDRRPAVGVEKGAVTVLTVHGELDLGHSPRLAVAVSEALHSSPEALVIDLCGADFVDSTGLAVLLNARRRTATRGIQLKIACDVPSTLRLIALTRIDRDLDIYPTREEALAALRV